MASEATLKFLLVGEDRSAGKALRNAGRDAESTGEKFKRLGKIAAVGLAGGLIAGAGAALKLSKAAAEDEKAAVRLETSLRNATGATASQVAATEDWITSLGKSTGITDDELRPAVGRLALATKDLGKAQGLTRLAMDVSVGTGKSLEAITTALGKAQTGNVAGLGRLGIATKNADGKTKSLKQITAELSTLYGGQAARAADTAAGKQKILTTRMGELGETIGAKVQPLMLKATDAALKLADEFENGTGAGGEIRDVLEDVAAAGKSVKDFFDDIPGPVKKYGAELAIAAVVMSKFRGLIGPVSMGLSTMVTNFKSAETRTAGLAKGLRGLGSGLTNVAGAGGMVLLADGANEAGTSMGFLKSAAGGALSGAALGAFAGPAGAAVGAALGGLTAGAISLLNGTKDAGESAKVSIPSWTEYGQTLDGVAASTTKATRAMTLQRLEESGLLSATRALGLSDREAVSAMSGNISAREKLAKRLRTNYTLTQEQRDALLKETGAVGAARLATLKRNVALAETAEELAAAKEALRRFMKQPADKRIAITSNVPEVISQVKTLYGLLTGAAGIAQTTGGNPVINIATGADGIPKRAMGGPVTAGQPYIVGDGGRPELFVPNQSGTILPRVPTGGGSDIDYARMTEAFIAALMRVPITRLSDAGRGAYQSGASF